MSHTEKHLKGKRLVMLVENYYEDLELWYPTIRLREDGAEVVIVGPKAGQKYESKHGYPCTSDASAGEINVDDFDGIIVPGGYAPDHMRRHKEMVELVRKFAESDKLVAFICHGGWMAASAGVLDGVRCTGFFAISDDLKNAGAHYEDKSVVVDGKFVSSRSPEDLADFCTGIIGVLLGCPDRVDQPVEAVSGSHK